MERNTLSMIHAFLRRHVQPGALCIDATAGRGRDTALLCALAGTEGRVLAFDIQQCALDQTEALLAAEGLRAELHLDSHAFMANYAAADSVDCIVFNFGRLPGGDPEIMTRPDSSVAAVDASSSCISERSCMMAWARGLDSSQISPLYTMKSVAGE